MNGREVAHYASPSPVLGGRMRAVFWKLIHYYGSTLMDNATRATHHNQIESQEKTADLTTT